MIKRPYLSFTLLLLLSMCILEGCEKEKSHTVLELFSESQSLSPKKDFYVNEDSIAIIEGLSCDGKNLIVNDYHSGCCYTLFDKKSGEYIARFGTIGQGPAELPSPCYGYLTESDFTVFDDQTRIVMKYSLDSLRNSRKKDGSPVRLAQYKIPEAQISKLIAIDDTTFCVPGHINPVSNICYLTKMTVCWITVWMCIILRIALFKHIPDIFLIKEI